MIIERMKYKMTKKDAKILEILKDMQTALFWLNKGGSNIDKEVTSIEEKIDELTEIMGQQ